MNCTELFEIIECKFYKYIIVKWLLENIESCVSLKISWIFSYALVSSPNQHKCLLYNNKWANCRMFRMNLAYWHFLCFYLYIVMKVVSYKLNYSKQHLIFRSTSCNLFYPASHKTKVMRFIKITIWDNQML